jgi:hypothetical protein
MWSGPRNISTAMMRAFENRDDTVVVDEPYYAAYLHLTGLDHPMRDEVLASQPIDPAAVEAGLSAALPAGISVQYEKHMTHHMLPEIHRGFLGHVTSAFLIRRPENVLASYTEKRGEVTLRDIGFEEQWQLFQEVADLTGKAPPVIDSSDVVADPEGTLTRLCDALGIPFSPKMLAWPAGRRASDGVWAPHWYHAVEASTGFGRQRADVAFDDLADHLKPIAEAARPIYEAMAKARLV